MTKIVNALVLALAVTAAPAMAAAPALARLTSSNVLIPSAQNSGVGIGGLAGTESGPPVQRGTVGSAAATRQYNVSIAAQDPSGIPALPGTEAGPSAKTPSHLS